MWFTVDQPLLVPACCTCRNGMRGIMCKHQLKVILTLGDGAIDEGDILRFIGQLAGSSEGGLDKLAALLPAPHADGRPSDALKPLAVMAPAVATAPAAQIAGLTAEMNMQPSSAPGTQQVCRSCLLCCVAWAPAVWCYLHSLSLLMQSLPAILSCG